MCGKNSSRNVSSFVLLVFTLTVLLGLTAVPARAAGETGWYCQRLESGKYDCVAAGDADNAWVGTSDGNILKTSDGGATWNTQLSLGADSAILDIAAVDKDTAWAVGYSGQASGVVKTTDGGAHWDLVWYFNSPGVVTCISALDKMTAWAGGGGIIKTGDGGKNWIVQYQPATYLDIRDITAADSQVVWAVYNDGILKTSNGGSSWEHQYDWYGLHGISASDSSHAWAVSDGGYILNTTDGNTWSIVHSSSSYTSLQGVAAVSGSTAWAVGIDSTILKTTDSGANWDRQYSWPPDNLKDVTALDADTVWAVGDKGIFHTTDGGAGSGPRPYLESLNKSEGRASEYLRIQGQRFGWERFGTESPSYVSFGSVPATEYWVWSDNEITCRVPQVDPTPSTVQVTVTTQYGTSNGLTFTVNPPPSPVTVSAVWPPSGFAGSAIDVMIAGTGFQYGAKVELSAGSYGWGSVKVSNVYVLSDMIITCRLDLPNYTPTGVFPPVFPITSYGVHVINPDGGYSTGSVTFGVMVNPCGAGAGTGVIGIGLLMGTLSLGGALRVRRRRRRVSTKK
jgi:photosystem II stability/assembly factor-like uncharacterized protein